MLPHRPNLRAAFTLLEVVLVVVIIFLMILALIPALRPKHAAQRYSVLPPATPTPAAPIAKPKVSELKVMPTPEPSVGLDPK